MPSIVQVYVMTSSLNIDRPFTYYSDEDIKVATRVKVIFNRVKMLALVVGVEKTEMTSAEVDKLYGMKISRVIEIVDDKPIFDKELQDLASWLAKTTLSPYISCINAMLPKAFKITKEVIKPKKIVYIEKLDKDRHGLTSRQKEVLEKIDDGMSYSDARKISTSIVSRLLKDGYIIKKERDDLTSNERSFVKKDFRELTVDQKKVYDGIIASKKTVDLLYGVTGSGKTEVYLHLARHELEMQRQVLILVPEIALTPQMIERVRERFDDVAIYHSYLNDNERYREYMRVKNREVEVVVGTRSAIFLPFSDLGLIIIDEEHDHSYKQDNVPCYSAKNVAYKRALDLGAKVLLASATPSLDTFTKAKRGDYGFFELTHRINESIPKVEIVDLKKEVKSGGSYIISKELKEALDQTLARNKQAIILLNRRGYTPIIRCADCMSVMMCDDCDTALTYHKDEDILKCNICGKTYKVPVVCPNCGSPHLVSYGLGTKKVVETLEKMYPEAKVGRMDADNTHVKDGHAKILKIFERHGYDILVGTQMIAKGLDYPDVTLVGILSADNGLLKTSFNSTEMTFDLLMQASGRSGRAKDEGRVIIQAMSSDHYVLRAVKAQDYLLFYNIEMNLRKRADYPPYTRFVIIILSDTNKERLERSVEILEDLTQDIKERRFKPFRLNKINRKERYRFTFLTKDLASTIIALQKAITEYTKEKNVSALKVDVDPLYME